MNRILFNLYQEETIVSRR